MDRKVWKYIAFVLIVLLATQLHTSAIVCVFVAAVVTGKPFNKRVKLAMLFGILFCLMPGLMNQYMGSLFSDSKYLYYLNMSGGMTIFRAFVTGIFPAILALLYLRKCKKNKV